MIEDSRKLKRGLKDISPLFSDAQENEQEDILIQNSGVPNIQCLSILSREPGEGLGRLSRYLGAHLATENCPFFVIRIVPSLQKMIGKNDGQDPLTVPAASSGVFQEYHLTWEQYQAAFKKGLQISKEGFFQNLTVFLDFPYAHRDYVENILPLLDKWILLMEPTLRSMAETYRMIKTSLLLNRTLEYFVLIQSPSKGGNESFLFEQFSESVTRRLGVHLNWLGHFQSFENGGPFLQEAALNQLLCKPYEFPSNFKEKKGLAELISAFSQSHPRVFH